MGQEKNSRGTIKYNNTIQTYGKSTRNLSKHYADRST